eukprot:CAMPEP_0113478794 /NCGR_PEP_ID=MMETSP0014_2-20120614/20950_1 /TAXON_ID=2857 /ORGANISM="Nitzschia sp." /LENGTH=746 /DNA_ID=CAMNT_0000372017 /DNA_START=517 /DNA_END=2757 /DNA_ORIENTATION=- /assembly_acc=CAM_ASM_000159
MSSGLEVQESTLKPNWVGKRIWINLSSLGFSSMYWGSAQSKKQQHQTKSEKEQEAQINYKSAWIKHMTLNVKDMTAEPAGVKIRPISGLEGVNYLSPGALTNHVSYVFGPVIDALQEAGYNSNPDKLNLAASPYDWRVAPQELERRDQYFTKTMRMVETLYKDNDNTPVVLIGHSMGCKTAHYFLNFALSAKGQEWLDTYVHTYMPVGAPHLGAPKALRSVISGDKMGLDAFLKDEEAIVLGRSLGSGPWLIPKGLPSGVPASAYILPHGVLQVTFTHSCDANALVNKRESLQRPTKYSLHVVGRGLHGNIQERRVVKTPFHKVSSDIGPDVVDFTTEHVSFGTLTQPVKGATLHFLLQEPGIGAAKRDKNDRGGCSLGCCILTIFCCIPYIMFRIIKCLSCGVVRAGALTADAITSTAGGGTTLAFSEGISIPDRVWKGETVSMKIPLFHQSDYGKAEGCCCPSLVQPRLAAIHVKLKWLPYDSKKSFRKVCGPVCQPSDDAPDLPIKHKEDGVYQTFPGYDLIEREGLAGTTLQCIKDSYDRDPLGPRTLSSEEPPPIKRIHVKHKKDGVYQTFPGYDLVEREGLSGTTLQCIKDSYDRDPLGPRTLSSEDPPPIKRIHAIYGINLPTEVGGAYKRKDTCISVNDLDSLYEPDTRASIDKKSTGYQMKGGILFETPDSTQRVVGGKQRNVSGDGTVPYWSLEHSKSWNGIDGRVVTVVELEKAEHREILADPRFHEAILQYCRT